jgi:hypothetical protein
MLRSHRSLPETFKDIDAEAQLCSPDIGAETCLPTSGRSASGNPVADE